VRDSSAYSRQQKHKQPLRRGTAPIPASPKLITIALVGGPASPAQFAGAVDSGSASPKLMANAVDSGRAAKSL